MSHPIARRILRYGITATLTGLLLSSSPSFFRRFSGPILARGSETAAPSGGYGASGNSTMTNAPPQLAQLAPAKTVHIMIDALTGRHLISPYVYGGAYPQDAATITDSGLSVVRWGGNATSRYNWIAGTENSAADWYFGDYG
jgi:hypothetical protein